MWPDVALIHTISTWITWSVSDFYHTEEVHMWLFGVNYAVLHILILKVYEIHDVM